jgi:hypothetical protein
MEEIVYGVVDIPEVARNRGELLLDQECGAEDNDICHIESAVLLIGFSYNGLC